MTDSAPALPPPPRRALLPEDEPRSRLVRNVREALRALPFYFESKTVIEGLDAGDLFSLNSVPGTPISGIEARHWIEFFRVFTDASDPDQVERNMNRLLSREGAGSDGARAEVIVQHIRAVNSLLNGEPQPEG